MKKIYAMLPARMGSTRLKNKNIRLLNGKPLVWYGLHAAIESNLFEKVFLNTDEPRLEKFAKEIGCSFYHRSSEFASNASTADDVIYDFFKNTDCEILFWINTTNPFQPTEEYENAIKYFIENNLDGLITTTENKIHTVYKGEPLNFSLDSQLSRTQDLEPVLTFAFPFSIWKRESFIKHYEEFNSAYLRGKIHFWNVNFLSTIEIDTEADFILANSILIGMENKKTHEAEYYEFG